MYFLFYSFKFFLSLKNHWTVLKSAIHKNTFIHFYDCKVVLFLKQQLFKTLKVLPCSYLLTFAIKKIAILSNKTKNKINILNKYLNLFYVKLITFGPINSYTFESFTFYAIYMIYDQSIFHIFFF